MTNVLVIIERCFDSVGRRVVDSFEQQVEIDLQKLAHSLRNRCKMKADKATEICEAVAVVLTMNNSMLEASLYTFSNDDVLILRNKINKKKLLMVVFCVLYVTKR